MFLSINMNINNDIQNIIANYKPCVKLCSSRSVCGKIIQLLNANRPEYHTYSIKNILQYINNEKCYYLDEIIKKLYSNDHHSDSVEDIINKFKKSSFLFNNICNSLYDKGNNNPIILSRAATNSKQYTNTGYYENILNKLLINGEQKYINYYFKKILLNMRNNNYKYRLYDDRSQNYIDKCINKMINIYIQKCGITTQTCQILDYISDVIDKDNLIKFIQQKINPSKKSFSIFLHNNKYDELINIFLANGYNIDIDDVLESIKINIFISNIKNFNIEDPENKICEYAAKYNFHKYHEIIKYNYTMQSLYIACETCNIKNIKYIVNQGIKPDKKCLNIVCTNKANALAIKYFINNHNIKPDIDTFNIYIENLNNPTLMLLKNSIKN